MRKLLIICLCIAAANSTAQDPYAKSAYGVTAGLSFSFGTHVNRIGFNVAGYYNYDFAQANAGIRGYYNFQSLGLKEKGVELQLASGFQLGFGRRVPDRSPFIGPGENNLLQDYSIGYDYLIYLDKQNTKQTSGMLSATILDLKFATENDLFGFGQGWRDRYRTGGMTFEYRWQNFKFGINATMWTDDFTVCKKVLDSEYPARFGYKKDDKTKFGGLCVSTLSARVNYILPIPQLPLPQDVQLDIGIDSEHIRNFFQNKLIHDHYPIPEKLIKRNPCHIPMQGRDGGQYLYKDGQLVEKAKFYFNLGHNQGLFY